jgi:hypothetical protein
VLPVESPEVERRFRRDQAAEPAAELLGRQGQRALREGDERVLDPAPVGEKMGREVERLGRAGPVDDRDRHLVGAEEPLEGVEQERALRRADVGAVERDDLEATAVEMEEDHPDVARGVGDTERGDDREVVCHLAQRRAGRIGGVDVEGECALWERRQQADRGGRGRDRPGVLQHLDAADRCLPAGAEAELGVGAGGGAGQHPGGGPAGADEAAVDRDERPRGAGFGETLDLHLERLGRCELGRARDEDVPAQCIGGGRRLRVLGRVEARGDEALGGDEGIYRGLDLAALGVVPLHSVGDHAAVEEHVRLGLPVGKVDALEDLERAVLGLLDEVGEVVGAGVEHGDGVLVGEQAELAVLVDGLAAL